MNMWTNPTQFVIFCLRNVLDLLYQYSEGFYD